VGAKHTRLLGPPGGKRTSEGADMTAAARVRAPAAPFEHGSPVLPHDEGEKSR